MRNNENEKEQAGLALSTMVIYIGKSPFLECAYISIAKKKVHLLIVSAKAVWSFSSLLFHTVFSMNMHQQA